MLDPDKRAFKDFQKGEQQRAQQAEGAEARFWASAYGQARMAKVAGDRYFQFELAVDSTQQGIWSRTVADVKGTTRHYNGQGGVITAIEREGWELINVGFVFRETGQVSRDKFLSSGQQVRTAGMTVGIYLFRATDEPGRTDEYWRDWQ